MKRLQSCLLPHGTNHVDAELDTLVFYLGIVQLDGLELSEYMFRRMYTAQIGHAAKYGIVLNRHHAWDDRNRNSRISTGLHPSHKLVDIVKELR